MNGESEGLLQLPTDKALLDDPEFRRYVELYAKVTWAYFSQMSNTKLVHSVIRYDLELYITYRQVVTFLTVVSLLLENAMELLTCCFSQLNLRLVFGIIQDDAAPMG